MRTFKLTFTVLILAFALFATPARAQTPSARKILDDMLQALGGQEFLDVTDIKTSGRVFQFKRGELASGDNFLDYIKFPLMERTEFGKEKNKEITINNGNTGWKSVPKDKEPQEQLPAEIQEFQAGFKTSFDYILRFTLSDPKTTIQVVGSEIVDFDRTDLIELRDLAKNRIVFYINRSSKLPIKMQVRRADEKVVREERYGNWHRFQGILTPLFLSRTTDGEKTMEIRLETATYNSGLPDTLFTVSKK
jgi:hypothetical protein